MEPLNSAIELAKEAGKIQRNNWGRRQVISYKGVINIVTEVDKECEKLIVDRLKREFPEHGILAEEGSESNRQSDYLWVIDPLDGTVNYAHGYPLFAVSIALAHKGVTILGVVYEPLRDELFVAEKGKGAFLDGKNIHVSDISHLKQALLDTGFAYTIQEGEKRNNVENFERFLLECQAVRRDGAAAVDLCYVACGRFDGFWGQCLKPWDIAAGALLIQEAGGRATNFTNGELDIFGEEILVSNGLIHEQMMTILNR